MIVSRLMNGHSPDLQPLAEDGKVVLSCIGRGESFVSAHSISVKMVVDGDEFYEIDGRTYRLKAGQMLVVDAGKPLRASNRSSNQSRGMCIYLPATAGASMQLDTEDFPRVALLTADVSEIGRALHGLAQNLHRDPTRLGQAANSILSKASLLLENSRAEVGRELDGLPFTKRKTKREILNRLETARSFLHANAARAITLRELALQANLAPFYLNRCFAWAYGVTPIRYHRSIRLELAHRMLTHGQCPTEVAAAIGYGELSTFSHAFKREFGHSPTKRHETARDNCTPSRL